ncbi:MAG: hypothetical protein FWB80_00740 [Defluviitaleaceae bacterium]|nr:hypothetical protein [Defluviitaleaceae bacterium]
MFTENTREIIMEAIEEHGWLNNRVSQRITQERMKMAKKMLARGDSPEEVSDVTELSIEDVIKIANQMQKLPFGV